MSAAASAISLSTASNVSFKEIADILNDVYTGYITPITFEEETVRVVLRADSLDADESWIAMRDGAPVGCALVGRRDRRSRLGAMGVTPALRGMGVGRLMLERVVERSRDRADERLELEVIEGNTHAIRLYESVGFVTQRQLLAFEHEAVGGGEVAELVDVAQEEAANVIADHGPDDLPWQISGRTLRAPRELYKAHRLGRAWAVVVDTPEGPRAMRGLCVERDARRQGQATRLLRALVAQYSDRPWMAPALCPEDLVGELFLRAGFTQADISQRQMVLRD